MQRVVLTLVFSMVLPSWAAGQTNCVPNTQAVGIVIGRSLMTFQSPDHSAVDPAGIAKVNDYVGEIRVKNNTAVVTNFTVPKTSVVPANGGPSGCFQTLLPGMSGLLPSNVYTLFLHARNVSGVPSENPPTVDFFLSSASVPASPGNLSLVTP